MNNKQQIMEDMKIMSNEYINNLKNQIKAEDADFLRTLLNIPEHPFTDLTTQMFQTYLKKNADYGNSFDKSLDENGLVAAKVRLEDKFNRFGNLIKNEQQVNDESVEDTLLDMANYAIMTVMWMQGVKVPTSEGFTIDEFNAWLNSLDGDFSSKEVAATEMLKSLGYPPMCDGNIALTSHDVDKIRKDLGLQSKQEREITLGSIVKITEGHRTGQYDEIVAVHLNPLRYNLKHEKPTIFYFPGELELIK